MAIRYELGHYPSPNEFQHHILNHTQHNIGKESAHAAIDYSDQS